MASLANIEAIARAANNKVDAVQANTKTAQQLTSAARLQLLDAIYPRILNNGKNWRTDKGINTDYLSFEIGDIIQGWENDTTKQRWIEGIALENGINLPADIDDETKFFIINEKLR
jgi:hypothetical protein